jgi:hypothetical protein
MMTLEDWTSIVVLDVNEQALLGGLMEQLRDNDWQAWGVQLFANTVGRSIPDPYGFQDWQEWAQRLCGVI